MYLILILLSFLLQDQVPLKPSDEFIFKLDYEFRTKPGGDGKPGGFAAGKLPYAEIRITPTKLSDSEERVRITNNLGHKIYSRRAVVDNEMVIDMGFTDDLKDHISVYAFDIVFFSKKGDESRITLFVEEDGTVLINGEKHGKF
ncbi:MAG TPA: hypothetical protein PKN99_08815 [Cyclobacteriaceae bacterium]|nr:hypothetical protein [Cyclobacteriaceae bacterium]HNP07717.1 hypothetical protein [Cyclobacteriaceae bacterium]HRK54909.1 hypothetical protein [Cyclobacteriaceae bacterium]